jgi:hypothetical protein
MEHKNNLILQFLEMIRSKQKWKLINTSTSNQINPMPMLGKFIIYWFEHMFNLQFHNTMT